MKHPKEEELIAYQDGQLENRAMITAHLADCPECQAELARIDALLAAINSIPVPEPAEDYGQQVWQQISPGLPEKRAHWWDFLFSEPKTLGWLAPRRWVAAGAIAALFSPPLSLVALVSPSYPALRWRSTRAKFANASWFWPLATSRALRNDSSGTREQRPSECRAKSSQHIARAAARGRVTRRKSPVRQTALEQGDSALAGVLDELERVLLDVAHSPQQLTPVQLQGLRQRIETRNILFKVRVVGKELQQRGESGNTPAAPNGSPKSERNKA